MGHKPDLIVFPDDMPETNPEEPYGKKGPCVVFNNRHIIEGVTWRLGPIVDDCDTIERIWSKFGAAFNTIRFEMDITESPEKYIGIITRAHKMGVHLLPILKGVVHFPGEKWRLFPSAAAKFVTTLSERLEPAEYVNIAAFQIENELNHWLLHHREIPQLHKDEQQRLLIDTSIALREVESQLKQSLTPLVINYSFDTIFYRSFNWKKSYEDYFKPYATTICNHGSIDVVAVDWYPGTWTPGTPKDLVELVQQIGRDFKQKVMIAETGFSTGKQSEEKQLLYYRELREQLEKLEEPVFGICWYELFDGSKSPGLGLNPFSFIEDNFGLIHSQEGPFGSLKGSPKKAYTEIFSKK